MSFTTVFIDHISQGLEAGGPLCIPNGFLNLGQKVEKGLALVQPKLSAKKIHGLNPVGALINLGNLAVPEELLLGILLGESISAKHLDPLAAHFKGPVRDIPLGNGDENINNSLVTGLVFIRITHMDHIFHEPNIEKNASHALGMGFHCHENTPDIRMLDNGNPRGVPWGL